MIITDIVDYEGEIPEYVELIPDRFIHGVGTVKINGRTYLAEYEEEDNE